MEPITLREREGLVIGDDIHVTVLQVRFNQVRLAVAGARLTPPYREVVLHCERGLDAGTLELANSRFALSSSGSTSDF